MAAFMWAAFLLIMATKLFKAPSSNFWSTTLNGAINDSVDSITLNSTTDLNYPGYLIIDREDGNGNATPSKREVIYFTGITGSGLTGVTRGADGSTARSHSDGALVEAVPTVGMWNDVRDWATAEHSVTGAHTTDSIAEKTAAAGVTVDSLLIKDGRVAGWDGWMPAEQTWTYASATTITVPSGAASKYQKGNKIRLKQGGSYKYFYIITVADTLLTVTGGSTYTVANASITDNYYSKAESPQGFPQWFTFTPVRSVSGGTAPDYTATDINRFKISGNMVSVISTALNNSGGTAGAGASDLVFNVPCGSISNRTDGMTILGQMLLYEAGIKVGFIVANSATSVKFVYAADGTDASGDDQSDTTRRLNCSYSYEI